MRRISPPVSDRVSIGYSDVTTARGVLQSLDRLQVERPVDLEDTVIVERAAEGQVTVQPWIHQARLRPA